MWRSRNCRCVLRSTAPGWSAMTARPMPASSISAYLGCLPGFVIMAAADEAELVHMVATAPRSTTALGGALSARRRHRRRDARIGVPLEIGRGRIVREGTTIALLNLGGRLAECLKAAQELGAYGLPRRWPTRASPSRSTPTSQPAVPRARGLSSRSRKARSAASAACAASSGDDRTARSRAEDPHRWCCPTVPRPQFAERAIRDRRAQRPPYRRDRAGGARPRNCRATRSRLTVRNSRPTGAVRLPGPGAARLPQHRRDRSERCASGSSVLSGRSFGSGRRALRTPPSMTKCATWMPCGANSRAVLCARPRERELAHARRSPSGIALDAGGGAGGLAPRACASACVSPPAGREKPAESGESPARCARPPGRPPRSDRHPALGL